MQPLNRAGEALQAWHMIKTNSKTHTQTKFNQKKQNNKKIINFQYEWTKKRNATWSKGNKFVRLVSRFSYIVHSSSSFFATHKFLPIWFVVLYCVADLNEIESILKQLPKTDCSDVFCFASLFPASFKFLTASSLNHFECFACTENCKIIS